MLLVISSIFKHRLFLLLRQRGEKKDSVRESFSGGITGVGRMV